MERIMADSDEPRNRPSGAPRGFAAMDSERRREVARKGGASVPPEKRSFSQNRTLAATAGRAGGRRRHAGTAQGRHQGWQPRETSSAWREPDDSSSVDAGDDGSSPPRSSSPGPETRTNPVSGPSISSVSRHSCRHGERAVAYHVLPTIGRAALPLG